MSAGYDVRLVPLADLKPYERNARTHPREQLDQIKALIRLVVSYADPAQGHHGGIYQAMNWLYAGTSQPQRELILNGAFMHKRTATARFGTASPERIAEITGKACEYGPKEWKLTYLMPLDAGMRDQIEALRRDYPKRDK